MDSRKILTGILVVFGIIYFRIAQLGTESLLYITLGIIAIMGAVALNLPRGTKKKAHEDNSFPIIQLYSPDQWHDDQAIMMNETGRKKLIEALQSGATKLVIPAFVSDGEGDYLYVQVLPEGEIDKFKSPYTDEICRNLDGEAEKKEPKYPVTPEERKLIEQGKDAGDWNVIV